MKNLLLASFLVGGLLAPLPSMAQENLELIGVYTQKIDDLRKQALLAPDNVALQTSINNQVAVLNDRLGLLGVSPH